MTPRWKWPDYSSLVLAVFNVFGVVGYASGRWEPDRFSSAVLSARDLRTKRTP